MGEIFAYFFTPEADLSHTEAIISSLVYLITTLIFIITTIRKGLVTGLGTAAGTLAFTGALAFAIAELKALPGVGIGAIIFAGVVSGVVTIALVVAGIAAVLEAVAFALTGVVAGVVTLAFALTGLAVVVRSGVATVVGAKFVTLAIVVSEALIILSVYLSLRALKGDPRDTFEEQRMDWLDRVCKENGNISVGSFEGLTVNYCKKKNAQYIIRGLRNSSDFDYEKTISQLNNIIGDNVETLFFISKPEYSHISSTIVREIIKGKGDISTFVPDFMAEDIRSQY